LIKAVTNIFHPYIFSDGAVAYCCPKEEWSPALKIQNGATKIYKMLELDNLKFGDNFDNSLEAYELYTQDIEAFKSKARTYTLTYATNWQPDVEIAQSDIPVYEEPNDNKSFTIQVKDLNTQKIYKKTLLPATTIGELKQLIQDEININSNYLTLLFCGSACDNDSTMSEIGIQDESQFELSYNNFRILGLIDNFIDELWKLQNDDGSFSLSYDIANLLNISYSSLTAMIPILLPNNNYVIWITALVISFLQYKLKLSADKDSNLQKAIKWISLTAPYLSDIYQHSLTRIKELC